MEPHQRLRHGVVAHGQRLLDGNESRGVLVGFEPGDDGVDVQDDGFRGLGNRVLRGLPLGFLRERDGRERQREQRGHESPMHGISWRRTPRNASRSPR